MSNLRRIVRRVRVPGDRLGPGLLRLGRMRREGLAAAGAASGSRSNSREGAAAAGRAPRRAGVGLTDSRALVLVLVAGPGVAGKAVVVGEPGSLGPAADAELSVDVRQVVLDRLLAEPELTGDLLVRAARRDALQDLALAAGKAELLEGAH